MDGEDAADLGKEFEEEGIVAGGVEVSDVAGCFLISVLDVCERCHLVCVCERERECVCVCEVR